MNDDARSGAAPLAERLASHVPALDGLRGVAILMVMLFHYVTASAFGSDAFLTRKLIGLAVFGWTGVDLFFVLSGFLITGILLRAKGTPGYFRNFYMRRALRIFPLYYAALVVIFVIVPRCVAIDTAGVKRIFDAQGWLWAYAQDLAITVHNEDFFDVDWLWVGHFWSLAVEEHFYLLWPVLVFVCSPRALLATSLGLVVLGPVVRFSMLAHHFDYAAIYTFTGSRIDELALGGVVALLARTSSYAQLARGARWALAVSGAYLLAVVVLRRQPLWWGHWTALGPGFSMLALFAAGVLVLALSPERNLLRRVLESRVLRGLGRYSYGAYVLHTPLQPLYLRLFGPARLAELAHGLGHSGSRVVGLVGFAALGIGSTLLLAMLSFFAFETPFLKLKRYFEYGSAPGAASRA